MTRTLRLATILSIGGAMALTTLAHAQAPGLPPGAPGRPGLPGGPGALPGGGAGQGGNGGAGEPVTNAGTFSDSTFTDSSTSTTTGDSTLPNTGGEPLIMVLGGLTLAAGAFAVRRKLA